MEKLERRKGYEEDVERYKFLNDSYLGGDRYRDGKYLSKRALESDDGFEKRMERSSYTNYCAPVVNTYTAYLMGGSITRELDFSGDSFESFMNDVDGKKRSYHQFWNNASKLSSVNGLSLVIVDKPKSDAQTVAQEEMVDVRPYFSLYHPNTIYNYTSERRGYKNVLTSLSILEDEEDGYLFVKIWYEDRWEYYKALGDGGKPELIDSQKHRLGKIPAVFVINRDSGNEYDGISDISDIAELTRKLYRLDSDIEEIESMTAFPFLEIPEKLDKDGNQIKIGTSNALTFDPEAPNARASYIEPKHTSISVMLEDRKATLQDLEKISRLGGDITGNQRSVESGAALEVRFQQLNALLKEKASYMRDAEIQAMELYALWQGTEFNGTISYPESFGIRDVTADMNNFLISIGVVQSDTYRTEKAKELSSRLLKNVTPDTRKKIIEEIENNKINQHVTTDANGVQGN